MPLETGPGSIGRNMDELKHGSTYRRTRRRQGKKKAEKQRIAIALKQARKKSKRRTNRS